MILCWITKMENLWQRYSGKEAAGKRQPSGTICGSAAVPPTIFTPLSYTGLNPLRTPQPLPVASVFKGTILFVPEGRLSAGYWRRHKAQNPLERTQPRAKRAMQGSYRIVAFAGQLFSRTGQFLQMGPDPRDVVPSCKLFSKRPCRVGREVVVKSWIVRDRVDMSTGQ